MLMNGASQILGEPFSSLIAVFRKLRTARGGKAYMYQIPKKGVTLLLGSITLIPPTVSMKPSSYLKVTAIMSLIITAAFLTGSLFPIGIENIFKMISFCYGSSNGY